MAILPVCASRPALTVCVSATSTTTPGPGTATGRLPHWARSEALPFPMVSPAQATTPLVSLRWKALPMVGTVGGVVSEASSRQTQKEASANRLNRSTEACLVWLSIRPRRAVSV